MKIKYELTGINNFHNRESINLSITGKIDDCNGRYIITRNQYARLRKHFCGITNCHCAQGATQPIDEDETYYSIDKNHCEVSGE